MGKPLFQGKNIANQLELITDLLGTPSSETIGSIRNGMARRFLTKMRKKSPVSFSQQLPNADPSAILLLQRLLAFDPKHRPSVVEALADPYFKGLAKVEREPSCQPIPKLEFEFESKGWRLTKDDIRELLYREILEYQPQIRQDYLNGTETTKLLYPRQFMDDDDKENGGKSALVLPLERTHFSLPRFTVYTNVVSPEREPVRRNLEVSNNNMESPDRKFGHPSKAHPSPKVPTGIKEIRVKLETLEL